MDETYPQNKRPLVRPVRTIQQQEEKKERIKVWMATCLVIVALFVDLIQVLLTSVVIGVVLSPIISIAANFLFWIWFKLLDVSFVGNPKNFATFGGAASLEEIPGVDVLPWFTIGIILLIIFTRAEDKGGLVGKIANTAKVGMVLVGGGVGGKLNKTASIATAKKGVKAANAGTDMMDYNKTANMEKTLRNKTQSERPNTLDLKNRNARGGRRSVNTQSERLDQEINNLKRNIAEWKRELQSLKLPLSKFQQDENDYRKYIADMIRVKKNQGITDGELTKLERAYLSGSGTTQEQNSMRYRAQHLDKIIWSANNKLLELERKGGTAQIQIAA
jgi:hypothetical protein